MKVTRGLTAKRLGSAQCPMLVIEYGITLLFNPSPSLEPPATEYTDYESSIIESKIKTCLQIIKCILGTHLPFEFNRLKLNSTA